jgi:crotonobetainyl-CoA:carnitine CoA-transferase CaiB-like acyl-CoA transferase
VLSPQQALEDPHIRAAGLLVERPVSGSAQHAPLAPHPVVMSADPPVFERPAPALGQHSHEILAALGYDAAAIEALRAQRVI